MPTAVEPKIFRIAQTEVNRDEVQKWMNYIGANNYEIPSEEVASDPALVVALAAKRCYMSFEPGLNPNVTKVRSDMVEYFDNVLRSRHGSVLEHATYSYAMEGVTRVFTAEMNRHRAGWAISEGSLRFIRFDKDIPFWMPDSFKVQEGDDGDLIERKIRSQAVFMTAFAEQEKCYAELLKVWDMDARDKNFTYKKKVTSALRRIVGMGVATGGVWTGNFRALRHVISMRAEPAAEEEIFKVFCMVAEDMVKSQPLIFGDFSFSENKWHPTNWKV